MPAAASTTSTPAEPSSQRGLPVQTRYSGWELVVLGVAFVLPLAFSPLLGSPFWTPRAAVLLILLGIGLPRLLRLALSGSGVARLIVIFLVVAGLCTRFADVPVLALTGHYNWGTGWLFYASLGATWAIGTALRERSQAALIWCLLASAAANAAVSLAQAGGDLLFRSELALDGERAYGLVGNAVHLGAVMAGALALSAWMWTASRYRRLALTGTLLFASSLQVSGSRFALAVAAVTVVLLGLSSLRRQGVAGLAVVVVFALGLGLGAAVDRLDQTQDSATARLGSSSGVTARTQSWWSARHAVMADPILGAGPGQYRSATSPHRTLAFARAEGADTYYADAHNLFVEVLITTGFAGLLAGVCAAWGVARAVRGPLVLFALGAGAISLAEPLNVVTLPLVALCLGASATPPSTMTPSRVPWRVITAVTTLTASAAALGLVAGDYWFREAMLDFALTDAHRANDVLPFWPHTAEIVGRVHLFESIVAVPDDPGKLRLALEWRKRAAERDPQFADLWSNVAELEIQVPDLPAAERHFRRALRLNPQSFRAMAGLGHLALEAGDHSEAAEWIRAAEERVASRAQFEQVERLRARMAAIK